MRRMLFLLAAMFFGLQVFAQTTITGTVTDEAGDPIPGANVLVKDVAGTGTITDLDGKYSLEAPAGATTLIFSSVGMAAQEIAIAGQTVINANLKVEDKAIDEVMVVAYGTAKKKTFTGSAAKVDGDKLEMKNTSEITKALAGEVSGVQVMGGGKPGKTAKVRIRGYGSVNASRDPLYVVDGVPYDGDISSINPSDIESSTVLKDASAAALYGSRGANGVILITTKQGKKGKSEIEVNVKYGINMRLLPMYDVVDNPEQFLELVYEGLENRTNNPNTANNLLFHWKWGINPAFNMWKAKSNELIDPATGKFRSGIERKYTPESWYDNIFESKPMTEVGVKFSGGSEKTKHYTSFNYRDDQGYYIQSYFKRLNARSNLSQQVKSWLKAGLNTSYSYMEYSQPGQTSSMNNGFAFVNGMPSMFPVFLRDVKGNKVEDKLLGGYRYDYGQNANGNNIRAFGGGINPAGALQLDKDKTQAHQIEATPSVEIKFTEDLKFTSRLGVQYLMSDNNSMINMFYGDGRGIGYLYRTHKQTLSYTWNQILSYSHTFGGVHNLSAFAGHEVNAFKYKYMYGGMKKIADPFNTELNNGVIKQNLNSYTAKYSLESYIGQIKYDFDEKYFFQLNYRRDGTSRFPNDKWGDFGSVGVAWLLSRESFMDNASWVKELKLKASYGILGNQSLLDALGYAMYYPAFDDYNIENLNNNISLVINSKGNKDLTWEQSKTLNVGVDFNFADVIEGGLEYFDKNTENLLFLRDVPRSFGYAKLPVNSGKLNNSGIELELLAHIVNTNDLKININFNAARYTNEITEMPKGTDGERVNLEQHNLFAYQAGRSIYDYYMREYSGVNPKTGSPKWTIFYDKVDGNKVPIANMEQYKNKPEVKARGGIKELIKETTEVYDDATLFYQDKTVLPDVMGGFGIDISYKGFRLLTQVAYSFGGYGYDNSYADLMHNKSNAGYNWSKDMLNRWQKPGDVTDVPKIIAHSKNANDNKVNSTSSRFLTKKSYLSLNTINLSYSFPKSILSKLRLNELTLYASGDNLYLFSARKGFNPLVYEDGKSNSYAYSPLSSVTFGLRVKF